MRIQLLCIGKLKEKYLREACAEYLKRLQAYAKVEVTEIPEAKEDTRDLVLKKEGERIAEKIRSDTHLIALAIEGKPFSSTAFADHLDQLSTYGQSHITFLIGGSYGITEEILKKADSQISFSQMTFPHQLIRVFLLEQIYRACKINRGEVYHK